MTKKENENKPQYRIRSNISKDIKKGDIVEIVPVYQPIFGQRANEYFDLKEGEVVVKKEGIQVIVQKCNGKDLELIK